MSQSHKNMLSNGLLRVQMAMRQAISRRTITTSFERTGIYPFSLTRIMQNCKTPTNLDQRSAIEFALPKLADIMSKKGEIFGEDVVKHTGLYLPNAADKDALVKNRRRSLILTNKQLYIREITKKDEKAAAAELKRAEAEEKKLKRATAAAEKQSKKKAKTAGPSVTAGVEERLVLKIRRTN